MDRKRLCSKAMETFKIWTSNKNIQVCDPSMNNNKKNAFEKLFLDEKLIAPSVTRPEHSHFFLGPSPTSESKILAHT